MAYSFVAKYDNTNVASSTTVTVANVTYVDHETIIVEFTWGDNGSFTPSVSDGANTYTQIGATVADNVNNQYKATLVCKDAIAGTRTVTGTMSSAAQFKGLAINRYNGLDNSATPLGIGQQNGNVTGANTVTSGNLTPGSQPGMLFAGTVEISGSGSTPSAGTSFTSQGNYPNWATNIGPCLSEDRRITALSAVAGTFTPSTGTNSYLTTAIYIPESSSPSAPVVGSRIRKNTIHPGRHPDRFGKRLRTRRYNTAPTLSPITGTAAVTSGSDAAAATSATVITGTGTAQSGGDAAAATGKAQAIVPSRTRKIPMHPGRGPYNFLKYKKSSRNTAITVNPITGTAAVQSGGDLASASGTSTITGTAAPQSANESASAAGSPVASGAAAVASASDASAASGSPVISGTAAARSANDLAAASQNAAPVTGTAAVLSGGDVAAASGSPIISGTGAPVTKSDSAAAVASLLVTGFGAVFSLGDLASASGTLRVTGTGAAISQGDFSAVTGTLQVTGTGAVRSQSDSVGIAPTNSGSVSVPDFFYDDMEDD